MSPWYYLVVLIELPVLLAVAYAGGWWLYLLFAFVALLGMGEIYSAAILRRMRPQAAIGYLSALLLLAAAQFTPGDLWAEAMVLAVFVTVAASLVAEFHRTGQPGRLRDAALTAFAVLYIALPLSFVFLLCRFDIAQAVTGVASAPFKARLGALLMVSAGVWLSDTAAWAIGHLLGRRKLAPRLSPNKTIEGAVAGLVMAIIATAGVGAWAGLPWGHGLILGLVLGVAAQLGDLAESVIKRDLGVRDFGTLLGPHGGMLDTFDGMLFAAPVAWFYLWLFIG